MVTIIRETVHYGNHNTKTSIYRVVLCSNDQSQKNHFPRATSSSIIKKKWHLFSQDLFYSMLRWQQLNQHQPIPNSFRIQYNVSCVPCFRIQYNVSSVPCFRIQYNVSSVACFRIQYNVTSVACLCEWNYNVDSCEIYINIYIMYIMYQE